MPITHVESHLADPGIRSLLQDQAMSQFYGSFRPIKHTESTGELRDFVLETIGDNRITYLEFGVAEGNSMREIISRFQNLESKFFGFDSFVGLPENWSPHLGSEFPAGTFSASDNAPNMSDKRVSFVKGWIQNTLPSFLSSSDIGGPWPHLVHFDADLYSATLFILTTLWHFLPEYYFMMDEYPYDEIIALRDFANSYPVEIKILSDHHDKTFGWIRRVPFSLPDYR
jgi:hypothetical protein